LYTIYEIYGASLAFDPDVRDNITRRGMVLKPL